MAERTVDRVETTQIHQGMNASHRVREVLPHGRFEAHDPFLMLAEDWFVAGTFGDHPHRGFETVTFVLEGEVVHRDNHGGHGVLHPGDAQWMTAGRGVVHSEEAGPNGAHSLQLWINLPSRLKMSEPSYEDLRGAEMPVRRENGALLRFFAPSRSLTPITMIEMRIDAGASITFDLPADDNTFIYVISGRGTFGANESRASAGEVVWLAQDGDALTVRADETLHAMLWGGTPIRERVAARGPFVMNTYEEIYQAILDFQTGRF
ncbi:MAG TPA: pirin-like C-terminal cupin domain-containing protein [Thermoanaerobaculia bacterium]|nr:pirin-like C-terminal cupin domain-containing protein [Thermoanaerobaculia bacterium]